jgi:hypothetical protein
LSSTPATGGSCLAQIKKEGKAMKCLICDADGEVKTYQRKKRKGMTRTFRCANGHSRFLTKADVEAVPEPVLEPQPVPDPPAEADAKKKSATRPFFRGLFDDD